MSRSLRLLVSNRPRRFSSRPQTKKAPEVLRTRGFFNEVTGGFEPPYRVLQTLAYTDLLRL